MPGKSNDSSASSLSAANRSGAEKKNDFFGAKEAKQPFFSFKESDHSFFPGNTENNSAPSIQRKCSECEKEEQPKVQTKPAFESEAGLAFQTKLKIGKPNDPYEKEADAMAEKVVQENGQSAMHPSGNEKSIEQSNGGSMINAKFEFPPIPDVGEAPLRNEEKEEEIKENQEIADEEKGKAEGEGKEKKSPEKEKIGLPKRENKEEFPPMEIQTKPNVQAAGQSGEVATPNLQKSIQSSKGKGEAMSTETQSEMGQHFGSDFSEVRIHKNSAASEMNDSLNAKAFTNEKDIYFNKGEYNPESKEGKKLLAHELTHTVQQSGNDSSIQKFSEPAQEASIEGKATSPNDGPAVTGKVNSRVENDPRADEKDDLDEDEKREAKNPNRGEIRQEKGEVQGSGVSTPPDRGAEAGAKISEEKAQMNQQLSEEAPAAEGEAGGGEKGEEPALSDADAFAQKAKQSEQKAQAVKIPDKPEPFIHPTIEAPVDSAGEKLPVNSKIDTQVRGLGMIGEALRKYGYESKRHAAEQEIHSHGVESVTEKLREDLANAKEGTSTIETHSEERKEVSQDSKLAHKESVERQQFVAKKAPELAGKASQGSGEASDLASEAKSKAQKSQSEQPSDQDAAADAQKQSGQMNETSEGALSMEKAIQQTEERANQFAGDAESAAGDNSEAEARITETDEVIAQTDARVAEMHAKNAETQGKIDSAAPGPNLMRKFSTEEAKTGDGMITVSILLEQELISIQQEYKANTTAIESLEEAKKKLLEEQQKSQTLSPVMLLLLELAGISDEAGIVARLMQAPAEQREAVGPQLKEMEANMPEEGAEEKEGEKDKEDGKGSGDPREATIQAVENQRIQRLQTPLDMADQNMAIIPAHDQRRIANALVVANFTDQVKNIDPLQMGKEAIKGMVNPLAALDGVKGGFTKLGKGLSSIGDLEAWSNDPLGQLLKVAANISTGLAMIFSSILGIAGTITALMAAITVISWFTLSPVTAPVIAWMGTIMTYAGWGAVITGSLSVYFNYLSYIKNLHEAGTAPTAREMFASTEKMKENAADGLTGAMAVVEGVGAVKMGPSLKSGEFFSALPKSPGQFAKQSMAKAKGGITALTKAPGAIARGAKNLFKGGKKGIAGFRSKFQKAMARLKGKPGSGGVDIDAPAPKTQKRRQQHLDDTKTKPNRDMTDQDIKAEIDQAGSARKIDNDPEFDVEVKTNDHTYKKRKDGKGWCRHTDGPPACEINIGGQNKKNLDGKAQPATQKATPRQKKFEAEVNSRTDLTPKQKQDLLEYNKRNPHGTRDVDTVKKKFDEVEAGNMEFTPEGGFRNPKGKKKKRFDDDVKKRLEKDTRAGSEIKPEGLDADNVKKRKKKAQEDIEKVEGEVADLRKQVENKSDKDLSPEARDYKKRRDESFDKRHPDSEIRKAANEKFDQELGDMKDHPDFQSKRDDYFDAEKARRRKKHSDDFERGNKNTKKGEAFEKTREQDGFTRKGVDDKPHVEKVTIDGKEFDVQIDLKKPPDDFIEMKSGKVSLDASIDDQIVRHAALVKQGKKMTWEFLDGASDNVFKQLERFGIDYIDYTKL